MATKKKLNVSFLAIVLGGLAVGLAVVGGIVLVQYRNDPVKHITKGDELLAQGLPDKAVQQYLRGVGKAPFEMAYYDKAIDAIESIQPQTDFEAMEEFNRLLSVRIAKAEKASPQDDKDAEAVRAEILEPVLDESRIFLFSRELIDLSDRDRAYAANGRRFQLLDAAMTRAPDVDPRLAAAVRGLTLESNWRAAMLQTDSQWDGSVKRLRQAIAIDPTYVPNWYGLLRGQLDRFERSLIETGPRAASRLLEGEEGLLATLQEARAAVGDAVAPELDLIELELGQIALYAGAAGDGPEAIVPTPTLDDVDRVTGEVSALLGLSRWETRLRLEELRASALRIMRRTPSARTGADLVTGYRSGGVGLLSELVDTLAIYAPDDPRTIMIQLADPRGTFDEETQARQRKVIDSALDLERGTVGVNALLATSLRRQATLANFDLAISPGVEATRRQQPSDPEVRAGAEAAMQAVEEAFRDETRESTPVEVLRSRLVYETFLGVDARNRGDLAAAGDHFLEGSRAANQLRLLEDVSVDGRTLDAAMILAEVRGEFGEALSLLNSTIARNPQVAEDLDLRTRYLSLLAKAGRVEDAQAMIPELRARAAAESNTLVLARIDEIESSVLRIVEGIELADVKGADLLAAETEAAVRGDLEERRRLLDQIIKDPEVLTEVRSKALLRRAAIEAQEGDFGLAKQYAERVLDLDPGNAMAMLIMASDADTGIVERYRILARNAAEDEQGRDVALAGMIRGQLLESTVTSSEERDLLAAELERLLTKIATEPNPSVDAIRFLAGVALDEGRIADAQALADRLFAIEERPTSLSVLLRARILRQSGDTDGAIVLVRDAIDSAGLGTDGMYVLLGELLAFRGERDASREAYQRAFELSPSRPLNAMRLAAALLAEGRGSEALPVLRAARNAGRDSPAFLDRWLRQEMQAGNFGLAVRERRRRYEFSPTDFENAIILAQLLIEAPIGRVDVEWTESDAVGRRESVVGAPKYDEASWARLSNTDRQNLVLEVRERRKAEANSIISRMIAIDGTNPQVLKAVYSFLRGQSGAEGVGEADALADRAVNALRESLAGTDSEAEREVLELRLARLLAVKAEQLLIDRDLVRADELFREAVELEGDRSSDVDAIASSLYQQLEILPAAVPHQRRLLEEREAAGVGIAERREIARRLVEILVAVNDLESAEPIVDRYFRSEDPSASDLISLGAFTFGRADEARRNRTGQTDRRFFTLLDEADEQYARAAEFRAEDPAIDYARLKIAEYRWRWADDDERPALFAALRESASGFVSRHADSWIARRGLIDVLMARDGGDGSEDDTIDRRFKEAMAQIREFLELNPSHIEARLLLIDSLAAAGERRQALDVAQAALDRDPTGRVWAGRVGRIRTELREFDEAARQFGSLFEQTKDESYLQMQVMALMQLDPPRADAVIGLARANGQLFAQLPMLGGMYAAAMAQTGRRDLALKNFESLYNTTRQKVAQADPATRRRAMGGLATALPKLFPSDEQGVRDLDAFVDTISGGKPTLADLLNITAAWQEVLDVDAAADTPDPSLQLRADEAIVALLRRATTVEPDDPETASAYLRLGVTLQRLGDCPGSVEAFEQALALQPQSAQALNNLAYLLLECDGDLDRALTLSESAVERMAASPENRDTLGAILMRLAERASNPESREALLQQARDQLVQATRLARLASPSPAPWIRLAELELFAGRLDAARSALLEAGDLDPDPRQQARLDAIAERLRESG